jgi:hypothetical protein
MRLVSDCEIERDDDEFPSVMIMLCMHAPSEPNLSQLEPNNSSAAVVIPYVLYVMYIYVHIVYQNQKARGRRIHILYDKHKLILSYYCTGTYILVRKGIKTLSFFSYTHTHTSLLPPIHSIYIHSLTPILFQIQNVTRQRQPSRVGALIHRY